MKKRIINLIKIDYRNPDLSAIDKAVNALKQGKLIIIPTETVYGICCDAFNERAVKKLFKIKKRPKTKPLQILISNIKDIKNIAQKIPFKLKKIMKKCWPGPTTIVVKKKKIIPNIVTGGLNTVGIRIPNHPIAIQLIKAFGHPIAASSANISGKKPPRTARQAVKSLKKGFALAIDCGISKIGKPSKVLDASHNKIKTLRK